jgi:hypothetical protein
MHLHILLNILPFVLDAKMLMQNVAMIKSLNDHIAKLEDQAKIGKMNLRTRSLNMACEPF